MRSTGRATDESPATYLPLSLQLGLVVRRVWAFAIVGAVIALDQFVKNLVVSRLAEGESVRVFSWLDFTYIRNNGAAFGLFRGATAFLVLAALFGIGLFVVLILRGLGGWPTFAAALIAGGATGNLIDRALRPAFFRGAVVDFVDLRWWPAFNVADIAVSTGVGILLLAGFTEGKDTREVSTGDTKDDEPTSRDEPTKGDLLR